MRVLWITNRPIAAAEQKLGIKAGSGSWMEPALLGLADGEKMQISVASVFGKGHAYFDKNGIGYYTLPNDSSEIYNYHSRRHYREWEGVILREKPDLIMIWGTEFSHGLCALKVAQAFGIPAVIEMQGIVAMVERHYLGGMTKQEIRSAYSLRDFLKADSLYRQQESFHRRALIEREMILTAKNIIVENEWAENVCRAIVPECKVFRHNLNTNKIFSEYSWSLEQCQKQSIFCCAPGYPLKGLHMLIKALPLIRRKYPKVRLRIPGMEDPFTMDLNGRIRCSGYTKYIRELILQLDLRESVEFLGNLSGREMAEEMVKAHVMVIPSAIENHSITLRESMLVGTPGIASYVGGIPEVIEHGRDGFLYRFEDYESLAYYVMRVFSDDMLASEFSWNARNKMKKHLDLQESTQTLYEIYQKIIKGGNSMYRVDL